MGSEGVDVEGGVAVGLGVEVKVGLAVGVDTCATTLGLWFAFLGQRIAIKARQRMAMPSRGRMNDDCFQCGVSPTGDFSESTITLRLL